MDHHRDPSRRAVMTAGTTAAGTLLLPPGLRAQTAAPTPRRGGTLRAAQSYNPGTLDPTTGRNLTEFNVLNTIYDSLLVLEPRSLVVQPGLAKAWHFPDPKTLVLDLVEDVRFHDGSPCDSAAVKFNLERNRTNPRSNVKQDVVTIDSIELGGTHQVIVHLVRPNATILASLADRAGMIVSPKAVQAAPNGNIDRTPVGTGAFRFVKWEDGDNITVTRNPDYWRPGLPYLDGIVVKIVSEPAASLRAVLADESDIALGSSIQLKSVAERDPGVVGAYFIGISFSGMYLNIAQPPLDNKLVRQALQWACDRDALNKITQLGLGEPGSAVLPKEHWSTDPATFDHYSHDPDRARALLKEAGFPNGVDLPAVGWSDQESIQRQEATVEQFAQAGIRVPVTPMSPANSTNAFYVEKKFPARFANMGVGADPSQQYDNFFGAASGFNASGQETPEFRAMLTESQASYDQATRKQVFVRLQQWAIDEARVLPMLFYVNVQYRRKNVNGVVTDLVAKPRFQETWLA